MLKQNKFILTLTLFLIGILLFAIWSEGQTFVGKNNILIGFWTGFIAFIFLGASSIIKKILERQTLHYNSLVTLQSQLNKMIGIIKDNIWVMKGFKETVANGNVHWGNIKLIFLDESHFEKLHDIDLINKLYELYYDIRKLNDDWENLQNGYRDIKNAYIQKYIGIEQYVVNASNTANELETLELFAEQTTDKLIDLFARIRIQTRRDRSILAWIEEKFVYTSGKEITIHDFQVEKEKLEMELEASSKASRKEIRKIEKIKK